MTAAPARPVPGGVDALLYTLGQAAKAHERLATRHVLGKIVLRVLGQ